jgi:ubiquinone/menaquinone biosynthesis C-methylase UbiE
MLPHLWRSEVSRAVVDEIGPRAGEQVVDLGAGLGPATIEAARRGASVVAVDPSAYMRAACDARRRMHRSGARVRVVAGAAESIPLLDGSAHGLWSVNAMHHFVDLGRALEEIARVVRAGGRLVLVDEDFDDPTHPLHAEIRRRRAGRHHHFDDVDPVAVAERLRALGFADARGGLDRIAGRPAKIVRATRA